MFWTLLITYGFASEVTAVCNSDAVKNIETLWTKSPPPADLLPQLTGVLTYLFMDPGEMKLQGLTCLQTEVAHDGAAKDSLFYVNPRESLSFTYRMEQERPGVIALRGLGDSHSFYNYVVYFKDNVLGLCCCRVCDPEGTPCVEPYVTVAVLDYEHAMHLQKTHDAIEEAKQEFKKVGKTVPQQIASVRCYDVRGECDAEVISRIQSELWQNQYPQDILSTLKGRLTLLHLSDADIRLDDVKCIQMELSGDSGRFFIHYDNRKAPLSYRFVLSSDKADTRRLEVRDIHVAYLEHGVAALYQCFWCEEADHCDQAYVTVAVLDYPLNRDKPEVKRAIQTAKQKLALIKTDLSPEIRTDCD